MSEMASPAAVVEILITQKRAVTSGTFAASGCWLNTRSSERTLVWSPSVNDVGRSGEERPAARRHRRRPRLMVTMAVQPAPAAVLGHHHPCSGAHFRAPLSDFGMRRTGGDFILKAMGPTSAAARPATPPPAADR